jgi:hypothetical protein
MKGRPDFLKGEKSRPLPIPDECTQDAQFCKNCLFVAGYMGTFIKIYDQRFERL